MSSIALLTEPETARALHVSERTLQRWRGTGEGPAFVRAGRRILYRPDDIEAFLESSRARSTSEYGANAP